MQSIEQFSGKYESPFQYSVGIYSLWGNLHMPGNLGSTFEYLK
jgi:hypothetical protein